MIASQRFAFVFALALGATAAVGCSSSEPNRPGDNGGGDDGSGDGGAGSGSSRPQRTLDATGSYTVHSTFDIASNVPGTAGTVINDVIDATDSPGDPTQWILDQISKHAGKTIQDGISLAETFGLVDFANNELLSFAPDFVTTILQLGTDLGDITKNFGLIETLDVTGSAGAYTATHTVTGAHFKIGILEADFLLASYGQQNIVVDNVAFTMDPTGAITIASHDVPLTYGKLLRLGLDGAIIPLVDPMAQDLGGLLTDLVDCASLGQIISDEVDSAVGLPLLSAGTASNLCTAGLDAAANALYGELDKIDGTALKFSLAGTAKGLDTNGDGKIDAIATGGWTGMLSYGNTPTPLVPATFSGTRATR
jgi:hypothetical protein